MADTRRARLSGVADFTGFGHLGGAGAFAHARQLNSTAHGLATCAEAGINGCRCGWFLQHGQSGPLAAPQLGACGSSGRA